MDQGNLEKRFLAEKWAFFSSWLSFELWTLAWHSSKLRPTASGMEMVCSQSHEKSN
jgi:hypothetical protein